MIRRRPLARMAVRTTVVAGTAVAAGAVVGATVSSRNAARATAQAPAPPTAVVPVPTTAYAAPEPPPNTIEQLTQLASLRDSGALTEAEFLSQKSLLLT